MQDIWNMFNYFFNLTYNFTIVMILEVVIYKLLTSFEEIVQYLKSKFRKLNIGNSSF